MTIEKLTIYAVFVAAVLHAIGHVAAIAAKTFPGGKLAAFCLVLTRDVTLAEQALAALVPVRTEPAPIEAPKVPS